MDKGYYKKMISTFGLNSCKIPCCPIVKHNNAEFFYVIFVSLIRTPLDSHHLQITCQQGNLELVSRTISI